MAHRSKIIETVVGVIEMSIVAYRRPTAALVQLPPLPD